MKRNILIISSCLIGATLAAQAEVTEKVTEKPELVEVTSANGGNRLKAFHERIPKSDIDDDGVLTAVELHRFLDKKIKDGSESDKNPDKKVNLKKLKGLKSRAYLNAFFMEAPKSDTDGDGILKKDELLKYVLSTRRIINEDGEKVPHPAVKLAMEEEEKNKLEEADEEPAE